jgi:hypothetical protein
LCTIVSNDSHDKSLLRPSEITTARDDGWVRGVDSDLTAANSDNAFNDIEHDTLTEDSWSERFELAQLIESHALNFQDPQFIDKTTEKSLIGSSDGDDGADMEWSLRSFDVNDLSQTNWAQFCGETRDFEKTYNLC